jgi:DNA polymerase III subunit epsilon
MGQPYFIPPVRDKFLKLEKPIVFFDLETTGTSTNLDRIVELFAIKINIDGSEEEIYHLINPTIPIPEAAIAIHGITNEAVENKPTFGDLVNELAHFFEGCDLGGFNIKRFDIPMLMEEFHRHKKYPINFNEVKLVDTMAIYHSKEKRDLSAAVKFYCEREHEQAHSAKADVLATIDILKRQLLKYEDLEPNTSFLHDYLNTGNNVDINGKFVRDENGEVIFNFGKHQGKAACKEPDYLKWMLDGDFPVDTKMVANRIYKNCIWEKEINQWLKNNKIINNIETASALYTTIKFGENVFPFNAIEANGKLTVTYLIEPPSSYVLQHEDAKKILLNMLDRFILNGIRQ